MKDFERRHRVKVQISTFNTIDEAVAKLTSGAVQFDCFVPETVFLEQLVVGKLLQPLNHSYMPEPRGQRLARAREPVVRLGSRYTVPYTVYTTGIGWRADHLPGFDPRSCAGRGARCGARAAHRGKVGLLDDEHDGLTMGLLYSGLTDPNTESPPALGAAPTR